MPEFLAVVASQWVWSDNIGVWDYLIIFLNRYLFGISDTLFAEVTFYFISSAEGEIWASHYTLWRIQRVVVVVGGGVFFRLWKYFCSSSRSEIVFGTSTNRVVLINFFSDFGSIKLLRVFSIMKEDNFVIGISFTDSSMINLGKRVWSKSLSESDSACGRFSFRFFYLGFGLYP